MKARGTAYSEFIQKGEVLREPGELLDNVCIWYDRHNKTVDSGEAGWAGWCPSISLHLALTLVPMKKLTLKSGQRRGQKGAL